MKIPELTRSILEKKRVGLLKFSGGFALYSQHLHVGWYWCMDSDVKTGYSHMQMWVGPCGWSVSALWNRIWPWNVTFRMALLALFQQYQLVSWLLNCDIDNGEQCYSACTFVDTVATWAWLSDCAFANHEQFKLTQLLIRPVLKPA